MCDGGSHSSVDSAQKGGRDSGRPTNSRSGRASGGHGNFGRGRNGGCNGGRGGGHNNFLSGVIYQICHREGYAADRCYKYIGYPQKSASAATTSSYGADTNWYVDSGATDHITSELEKLTVWDMYHGGDQVHTASGSGMNINHVGHSILHTPTRNIHLNNILHVPSTSKISFLSIVLHVIIMLFLSFTRIILLLRNMQRGKHSLEGHVKEASTL
jgi:histone deacetylase 1/2